MSQWLLDELSSWDHYLRQAITWAMDDKANCQVDTLIYAKPLHEPLMTKLIWSLIGEKYKEQSTTWVVKKGTCILCSCTRVVSVSSLSHMHQSHIPTMHHFVTEMCTFLLQNCALLDISLVHCGICELDLLKCSFTMCVIIRTTTVPHGRTGMEKRESGTTGQGDLFHEVFPRALHASSLLCWQ